MLQAPGLRTARSARPHARVPPDACRQCRTRGTDRQWRDRSAEGAPRLCPVSLEVDYSIYDISGAATGPLARARGVKMANWQDPRMTGVNAATVGVPRAARDA